jgi:hypothetical protein
LFSDSKNSPPLTEPESTQKPKLAEADPDESIPFILFFKD